MTRPPRKAATKRTILGALDENRSNYCTSNNKLLMKDNTFHHGSYNRSNTQITNPLDSIDSRDFDGTNSETISLVLQELYDRYVKQFRDSIMLKDRLATKEQENVFFLGMMKIEKHVKKMTIRDFDEKYMKNGESILDSVKSILDQIPEGYDVNNVPKGSSSKGNMNYSSSRMVMETPLRSYNGVSNIRTPATIMRTVKKGEVLYSANGSPIETSNVGDLIATVSKKKRNGMDSETVFEINVGEGKNVSLTDPSTLLNLNEEMKKSAKIQLKALQEQMAKLMANLEN